MKTIKSLVLATFLLTSVTAMSAENLCGYISLTQVGSTEDLTITDSRGEWSITGSDQVIEDVIGLLDNSTNVMNINDGDKKVTCGCVFGRAQNTYGGSSSSHFMGLVENIRVVRPLSMSKCLSDPSLSLIVD